jgi:hypothetical protein
MKSLIEKAVSSGWRFENGLSPENINVNYKRKEVDFSTDNREIAVEGCPVTNIKLENFKISFGHFFSDEKFISKFIPEKKYIDFIKSEDKLSFLKKYDK